MFFNCADVMNLSHKTGLSVNNQSAVNIDLASDLPVDSTATDELTLLDRDQSILAFNERVLSWAQRDDVPLLERLRYLCIVSSNLDEFFEVRYEPQAEGLHGSKAGGQHPVSMCARALVEKQYALYNEALLPALRRRGIRLLSHGERDAAQRQWVQAYFLKEVRPLLTPVGLDPAHPFPQVANKSLNFIVHLGDVVQRKNKAKETEIAIVRVPRSLPRLIQLPATVAPKGKSYVSISSVVRAHLAELFPDRQVVQFSQFRVTRHSDVAVDEDDVENLRTAMRKGLQVRNYGQAARLEVSAGCSTKLSDFLLKQFDLPEQALFRVHGPVNLVRLMQLIDLVDDPKLLFPVYKQSLPAALAGSQSIFETLKQQDVLIHQPFESFDAVLAFLREAVRDPQVRAIKQTIYRTGSDPTMLKLLQEAVRRGIEVTAVVELKARFDEETNINWAESLEAVGVQVVYGVVGLKTHAKMLLVTRQEGRNLRRYGHLSTGNYNPRTARLYTDISHLTADPVLTADMDRVFLYLANPSKPPRLSKLLMAPQRLHASMVQAIRKCSDAAKLGLDARIVIKMNSLTDPQLVRELMSASEQGVVIDLIVRGACMLPAGIAQKTDRIRVRSVIGRFLEHSRVFYFRAHDIEQIYLSSADWMSRNMFRRVELAWPVTNPQARQKIIDECLLAYLYDKQDAWEMNSEGVYVNERDVLRGHSAQQALMQRYSGH
jgi:polyphosphate kinase